MSWKGLVNSFSSPPLEPAQREYLARAVAWARSWSELFEPHWALWEQRSQQGKAGIQPDLYHNGEGLYNALTGVLYLSSSRLPLQPQTCAWALKHWDHPVVLQGLVDVTAVIVHETAHALAGFPGSLGESGPYQRERAYLLSLARHTPLKAIAQSRLADLERDRAH